MQIYGWGRYPRVDAKIESPASVEDCVQIVLNHESIIPRGLARSYGDSSLAHCVLETKEIKSSHDFEEATGTLRCSAGTTFDEILRLYVPNGWFLPVTPGTRFITVGGAIASDVHGKNHHLDGTFSNHVTEIDLLLGNGEIVKASPSLRSDLFQATCGGMGLTGVILSATFKLIPITSSRMIQTTIKLPDLESTLKAFEEKANSHYSVAWIDSLATGKNLGRSLMILGSHATDKVFSYGRKELLSIPFDLPSATLNNFTVRMFNSLYYQRVRTTGTRVIPLEQFFYPLDFIGNWNRLYGKQGLLQYQFVIPKRTGFEGIKSILSVIAESGVTSFLAVLKLFGQGNHQYLSFPFEGYTLALDFKAIPPSLSLLEKLDDMLVGFGGRIYLSKDARMPESVFKSGYPNWRQFEDVRQRYHAIGKFSSLQSQRLGLQ